MRKALLGLISVIAIVCSLCAQEPREETEKTIEYPSPYGRFAFLFTRPPEGRKTLDVVKKDSGKILHRIVESDESFGDRLNAEVIWTPDSKRFAVTYMLNRRGSGISIYSAPATRFASSNCQTSRRSNFQPTVATERLPTSIQPAQYAGKRMARWLWRLKPRRAELRM